MNTRQMFLLLVTILIAAGLIAGAVLMAPVVPLALMAWAQAKEERLTAEAQAKKAAQEWRSSQPTFSGFPPGLPAEPPGVPFGQPNILPMPARPSPPPPPLRRIRSSQDPYRLPPGKWEQGEVFPRLPPASIRPPDPRRLR